MGEVWGAVGDPGPDGVRLEVAIKILLARAALKPDLVRRFEREAKIASAIDSPYVCKLVEVAEAEDGAHLLVFEQLTGESLADRLKREQYLPFSEVGPIIEDVLRGLAAAHEAGVVHRDLKPGNIFLQQQPAQEPEAYAPPSGGFGFGGAPDPRPERRERAKILDFGISKLTRGEPGVKEPTLTAFDATLGSFAYMAPEQVRGAARADERADIYAVGAVAFRALSGRLPFEGTTAAVLVAMKLDRQAPSLAEITGDQWPAGIERFLERALERRRELRFATAAEALEVWRSIQPSAVAFVPRERAPDAAPTTRVQAPTHQRVKPASIPAPTKPVVAGPASQPPRRETTKLERQATPSPTFAGATAGRAVPRPGPAPAPSSTRAPLSTRPPVITPSVPPIAPPPRPPMQSYQVIEDNPTEVDGPPEMTVEAGYNPDRWSAAAREAAKRRKAGRL